MENTRREEISSSAQSGAGRVRYGSPAIDILEHAGGYRIYMNMPNVDPGDLGVSAEKGTLTVSGSAAAVDFGKRDLVHDERAWRTDWRRMFSLGEDVDLERVDARLEKNGVLVIEVPRRAQVMPRQITVKAA